MFDFELDFELDFSLRLLSQAFLTFRPAKKLKRNEQAYYVRNFKKALPEF